MKKILAIICLILLCFTLVGCQDDSEIDVDLEQTELEIIDDSIQEEDLDSGEETTYEAQDSESTTDEVSQSTDTVEATTTKAETTTTASAATTTSSAATTTTNADTTSSATTNSTTTTASSTTTTANSTTTTASSTTTTTNSTTTTVATTTTTTTQPTTQAQNYCYVTIDMTNALKNLDDFTSAKASFVPSSGILLAKTKVYYTDGETLFDAIVRACSENVCSDNCKYCQASGIQIEYQYTPAYSSYYIEGVHQIYEMDCGVMSGWMVYVNGESIQSSSSTIEIQNGDDIVLAFTCSMGSDINF